MASTIDYTMKGYKRAKRYLKQFHPKVWNKVQDADGYTIILTAVDLYKGKRDVAW